MKYVQFPCRREKHSQMKLQYLCLHPKCVKRSNFLGCIHCGQDEHRQHMQNFVSIKVFINEVTDSFQSMTANNLIDLRKKRQELLKLLDQVDDRIRQIESKNNQSETHNIKHNLLRNLQICKTEEAFKQNLFQLINIQVNQPDETLVNQEMVQLRNFANNFQLNRPYPQPFETQKCIVPSQPLRPAFVFKQHETYDLISPCSAKSIKKGFTSILAHPSLNTFEQSVEFSFIIKKMKPNWIGVGVSRNHNTFSLTEKGFYLWISNGWLSKNGNQEQIYCQYSVNDKITILYDKPKRLIILYKNNRHYQPILMEVEDDLWNELHPCVVFYNSNDIVDIIQ